MLTMQGIRTLSGRKAATTVAANGIIRIRLAANGRAPRSGAEVSIVLFVCVGVSVVAFASSGYGGNWEELDYTSRKAVVKGGVVALRAEPAVKVKGVHVHGSSGASTGTHVCSCMGSSWIA